MSPCPHVTSWFTTTLEFLSRGRTRLFESIPVLGRGATASRLRIFVSPLVTVSPCPRAHSIYPPPRSYGHGPRYDQMRRHPQQRTHAQPPHRLLPPPQRTRSSVLTTLSQCYLANFCPESDWVDGDTARPVFSTLISITTIYSLEKNQPFLPPKSLSLLRNFSPKEYRKII